MAGPTPMALGPYNFEAIGFGFETQDISTDTPWAEIDTAHTLNAQQWTGPQSESFDISGVLFPHAFGGLGSLSGLKSAAQNGVPLMLVTRAGGVHGMHTIQGIREGRTVVDAAGLPHKVDYTISLLKARDTGGSTFIDQFARIFG